MGALFSCCSCDSCCKTEEPKIYPLPEPTPSPILESPLVNSGISKTNHLDLIRGYEQEPLVSLEEALEPVEDQIDYLRYHIRVAKTKCYYPSNPKLTRDESAAIYIYTMKSNNGCVYDRLQEAWKSEDPTQLKPWLKFLKLFKSAFDKLPDAKEEIWQGKANDGRLQEELKSTESPLYIVMDMYASSKAAIEKALEQHGVREKVLIGFKSVNGKLVDKYASSDSSEVLVWPGAKVGVSDIEVLSTTGSITFHMKGPYTYEEPKKPSSPVPEKHYRCSNEFSNCTILSSLFSLL